MNDLHDRFGAWLTDGARVELPRDAALHASACEVCLREAAAFDALLAIDPGAAPATPLLSAMPARSRPSLGRLRAAVGVAAVLLLAISVGIGAGGLLEERAELGAAPPTTTPEGEGILGGAGRPTSTPTDDPDETSSADPSASDDFASPEASEAEPAPTPLTGFATPVPVFTQRPITFTPPLGTPRPSSSSAATPQPPPPTAVPTVPPSPTPPAETPEPTPTPPTPTPAPTPEPPQCSNAADDDGDLLIDFPADLGCSSPEDDDESGPLP